VVIVFLFLMTIYYVWEPYQRGYLIQPWFVFALIVIYTFHPLIAWLSQREALFRRAPDAAVLLLRLRPALGALPGRHLFSLPRSIACGHGYCFI
jgi:hypothetical protein